MALTIANNYGNVLLSELPPGYVHIPRPCHATCRRLNIRFARAVVGFDGNRHGYKPQFDGVVIHRRSLPKLRAELIMMDLNKYRRHSAVKVSGFRHCDITDWLVFADYLDECGNVLLSGSIRKICGQLQTPRAGTKRATPAPKPEAQPQKPPRPSLADAVVDALQQLTRATVQAIADHLLAGGFPTYSKRFCNTVRVQLYRLQDDDVVVQNDDNTFSLIARNG